MNKIWKTLITTLMDKNIPFSIVNNVLEFKGMPDGVKGLWLWFGEIRVVMEGDMKAGDMLIMSDFDFTTDNELVIHTRGGDE